MLVASQILTINPTILKHIVSGVLVAKPYYKCQNLFLLLLFVSIGTQGLEWEPKVRRMSEEATRREGRFGDLLTSRRCAAINF